MSSTHALPMKYLKETMFWECFMFLKHGWHVQPVPGRILQIRRRILRQNCPFCPLSLHYPNTLLLGSTSWSEAIFGMSQTNSRLAFGRGRDWGSCGGQLSVPALAPHGHAWKNRTNQHMVFAKLEELVSRACAYLQSKECISDSATSILMLLAFCFHKANEANVCMRACQTWTCPFTKS